MIEVLSIQETAVKWNVSERKVLKWCINEISNLRWKKTI